MTSRFKWTVVGSSTFLVVLLLVGALNGRAVSAVSSDDVYGHLKVYSEVLQRIKLEYVEEPDMKSVTVGAINGLLESVDPFASYLNPDQYRQYEKMSDQKQADVGLVLAKRFGYVAIVDAVPGSPAAKANLSTGDLLDSIKGIATRDMPLAYAEQLLRGEPGSTIEITVLRAKNPEPVKLTLTRAAIQYPAVTAKLMPEGVGDVQVETLEGNAVAEVRTKVEGLKKEGAKYIVLDLRHCSTGNQENGIALANLFIDKGEIAALQGQRVARKEFDAKAGDQVWSGPLVITTNRSTAGGAEVTAAALLDNKRAQVVGERTYGDAGVRRVVQMDDGAAVILSVAKYYSPSGKAIQDTGVVPTVQVAEADTSPDYDDNGNPIPGSAPKNVEDSIMKNAIQLVTGKTTVAQLNSGLPPVETGAHGEAPILQKNNVSEPQ
ncbi:MAG: S41 family peptidase [Bryobacteraceae bacterium]